MNNMDAALKEAERAIKDLHFRGVYLHTPVDEKPLDAPEFLPLYEMMSRYDLPIVIHPMRKIFHPDFLTEKELKYMFYADTAIYGNIPALMCGRDFFGPEHVLFGIDSPPGRYRERGEELPADHQRRRADGRQRRR